MGRKTKEKCDCCGGSGEVERDIEREQALERRQGAMTIAMVISMCFFILVGVRYVVIFSEWAGPWTRSASLVLAIFTCFLLPTIVLTTIIEKLLE